MSNEQHKNPISVTLAILEGQRFEDLKVDRASITPSWQTGFQCAGAAINHRSVMTADRLNDAAQHVAAILRADHGFGNSPPEQAE